MIVDKSESIGALAAALAKTQGVMKGAKKDATNPYFQSTYADLESVWDACRGPLASNGLAVIQTMAGTAEEVQVNTTLVHSSGEWISGSLVMRPVKVDPQGIGSAITYARRYALAAIVGIAPEDDDGNAASGNTQRKGKPDYQDHPSPKMTPTPPVAPEGDTGRQTVLVTLGEVKEKEGKSAKGAWFRTYSKASDGEFYSTFDTTLGDVMAGLAGEEVQIVFRVSKTAKGESRDVLEITPVIVRGDQEHDKAPDTATDPDAKRKDGMPF